MPKVFVSTLTLPTFVLVVMVYSIQFTFFKTLKTLGSASALRVGLGDVLG